MGGKAKFKKHTAADLERRQKQVNKGGGKTGAATRAVAKLNFTCDICMVRLSYDRERNDNCCVCGTVPLTCAVYATERLERVPRHQVVRAALYEQTPQDHVRPRGDGPESRGAA